MPIQLITDKVINAIVSSTKPNKVIFTSLDQKFKVDDTELGKIYISDLMNGLIGKSVFGSGFPTLYRKYPAIRVL